jgi:hypothetical protein
LAFELLFTAQSLRAAVDTELQQKAGIEGYPA